jgi:adenosylcobinamide kinase/adenosylcobinamide-phosphate guanylyltransferase
MAGEVKNPLVLITGGCRSGKSAFAQQMAEKHSVPRLFLATCPCLDTEMEERIRKHKEMRSGRGWQSVEEEIHLDRIITGAGDETAIVIDCLTLWISNLLYAAGQQNRELTETDMVPLCEDLAGAARSHQALVIMVTGEVGLGIVPENRQARLYRDLVGRCNQIMAGQADQVFLMSCGLPLRLK